MATMKAKDVLIVGSGIAGPTLASFLLSSSRPYRITMLERAPRQRGCGQNVDVRGGGRTILKKLGIEALLEQRTTGEEGVEIIGEEGEVRARLPADRSREVESGTGDMEVLRGHLAQILWERSQAVNDRARGNSSSSLDCIYGEHITELQQSQGKVQVRYANSGAEHEFDLVVAADGVQSQTRRLAFAHRGIEQPLAGLNLYGAFFSMRSRETDSLWRRWFHAPGGRSIMLRPDRVNGRTTAFISILNTTDTRLKDAARLSGEGAITEQQKLLDEHFRSCGWESERIVEDMYASDDFWYNEIVQVKQQPLSCGSVVLLGDAGYCPSPISGMGTTLAIHGAYTLAGCLQRHLEDQQAALSEYELHMRPAIVKGQKMAPGAPNSLNPTTNAGVGVFNNFLSFIDKSGLAMSMFKLAGPPAKQIEVEDYGFTDLPLKL